MALGREEKFQPLVLYVSHPHRERFSELGPWRTWSDHMIRSHDSCQMKSDIDVSGKQ